MPPKLTDAEAEQVRTSVTFAMDNETKQVIWEWKPGVPDLTLEQAQAIGHIQGLHSIASALGDLAAAVDKLADAVRERDD